MKKIVPILIITLAFMIIISKIIVEKKAMLEKKVVLASSQQNLTTPAPKKNIVPPPAKQILPSTSPIRGIYATSWVSGTKRMSELIQFVKESPQINGIVIDVKDDTGVISYPSSIPLAQEIGANSKRISNLQNLVEELKKAGIYTIARVVVFKDPLLATKRSDLAVKTKTGGLWRDRKGMIWVDPHNKTVWKYNLDIAKEAVKMGFSEVQFDYVRFLSDGKISQAVYPHSQGELHEDVIGNFLKYAKKDLNQMGVPLSADIFGLVLSVPDDLNIGQKLEKIADSVDYISPMVYPSHYPKGTFGISEPDKNPYDVIDNAMKAALKRIPSLNAKLRPWIQDFDLGNPYGKTQIEKQVKALKDHNVQGWLLWNPSNRYDPEKYNF